MQAQVTRSHQQQCRRMESDQVKLTVNLVKHLFHMGIPCGLPLEDLFVERILWRVVLPVPTTGTAFSITGMPKQGKNLECILKGP